jgi:hypothetical protein
MHSSIWSNPYRVDSSLSGCAEWVGNRILTLPANAGTLAAQAFKGKSGEVKASSLVYVSRPDAVARAKEE